MKKKGKKVKKKKSCPKEIKRCNLGTCRF